LNGCLGLCKYCQLQALHLQLPNAVQLGETAALLFCLLYVPCAGAATHPHVWLSNHQVRSFSHIMHVVDLLLRQVLQQRCM
jgi:hypothetical protein